MPAETHQRREPIDATAVVELIALLVGVDPSTAASQPLHDLDLDDDVSIFHLWTAVVEEFGERAVGDLDLHGHSPTTIGELADLFHDALP